MEERKNHVRAQIRLDTSKEVLDFVSMINRDGTADRYVAEDFDGSYRMNARSMMQMLCAMAEFCGKIFLVNDTHDGVFPDEVDRFRA